MFRERLCMDFNLVESANANVFPTSQLENPGVELFSFPNIIFYSLATFQSSLSEIIQGQPNHYANGTTEGQPSRFANETTEDLIMRLRSCAQELSRVHSDRATLFEISNSIAQRREELRSKYASLLACGYIPPFGELSRIEFLNWNMDVLFNFMAMAYERQINFAALILSMDIPSTSLYQQLQNSSAESKFMGGFSALNMNQNRKETSGVRDNEIQQSENTSKRERFLDQLSQSDCTTPSEHRNTTKDDSESKYSDSVSGSWTYQDEESDKNWLIEHEEEVITNCNGHLDEQLDVTVGQIATGSPENFRKSSDEISKIVVVRPFKWVDAHSSEEDSEILKKHVMNE
ncbi:hypothetical protein Y032_0057g2804 [Ancylostoma ceylanicum]|uniref:Uncharacterized protein n=2 Tax=Ancylostoma ceylanicum TaxID=53326 RepID=A0A016U4U8_9BILA|nr:hypothetical protein Y032_0057g2804 [Ancylostoma ceylanicum]